MKEKNYVSPILDRIRKQTFEEDMVLAHDLALRYVKQVNDMRVFPDKKAVGNLSVFEEALSEEPEDTKNILNMLGKYGSPATVAQTGGRYFGFVCGGILPPALCSKWLSDAWDQNSAL
ncbi:MAG: aspartate aminotransferase family protein, partial [Clostridiaceae bacterium]|nr:aspartate aminotransferase family protein [Clostridiaceae bacterium]